MKTIWALSLLAALPGAVSQAADQATPPPPQWDAGSFSLIPRAFQKSPHLNVIIFTEMSKVGRTMKPPTPGNPTYYLVNNGGLAEEGDVVSGEKPPSDATLAKLMETTLNANGYLPASKLHAPSLILHYRYGSFNQLSSMTDPTGANGPDPNNPDPPDDLMQQNLLERAALVGGMQFTAEMSRAMNAGTLEQFRNKDFRTTQIMDEIYSNRYFVIATAYDYGAALKGVKVVLWQTKVSTNSQGVMMNESLLPLVAAAGPYFGHETSGAVRLNRPVVKEGTVIIGTPTVESYGDSGPAQPAPEAAPKP
jgi:hypothetical protein